MPVGDILPEIAVLLSAVAVLVLAMTVPQERHWMAALLALAGLAFAAYFCIQQLGMDRLTFSGLWAIDGASVWARLMILAAAAATAALSPRWFQADRRHGEFYAILLLSTLGAMMMAGAADLLQLTMSVLLSSVTGYTLAAYHRNWPLSVEAGMKYFLVGALANALLVIGVTLLFGMLGTTGYDGLTVAIAAGDPSPLALLGIGLLVVGVGFKLGVVPAHAWVPDVAQGAPAPAAAFLTVAPKIGAAIALVRLVSLFPPEVVVLRDLVAVLAVATMTLGNLAALAQEDIRRMLGWSSVSQSGYALMAVALVGFTQEALPALLVFLLGYTLANLAAFAAVTHLRGRTGRTDFLGIAWTHPWTSGAIVLAFLSLIGIPPLAGFVGKLTLFTATIAAGYTWLAVVAAINTVISLYYYLRFLSPMYFGAATTAPATLGRWSGATTVALGGLTMIMGVLAELSLGTFASSLLIP